MKTTLIALAMLGLCGKSLFAQVAINASGKPANSSAMLDVQSTEKGMLVPSMKSASRIAIASPADGLLVYDVTSHSFWFYKSGTGWQEIGGSGALQLPYAGTASSASDLFSVTNSGSGAGMYGSSVGGYGIYGKTGGGTAGYFTNINTNNTNPVLSINNLGIGAGIDIVMSNAGNGARGISVDHQGVGPGILVTAKGGTAVWGITSSIDRAGVMGDNTFGEAILGRNRSAAGIGAVVGRNDDAGYGIYGYNTKTGIGVFGKAGQNNGTGVGGRFENINASNTNPALEAVTNGTGWAASFTNTNGTASGKGLMVSTAANEGGNALRISNGVIVASYQDPYTSNAIIDDSYLIVRNTGNITLRTTGVIVGTVVWLVNFSGGVVTVTNAQAGTYNVSNVRATQFIFLGGTIWTPVQ